MTRSLAALLAAAALAAAAWAQEPAPAAGPMTSDPIAAARAGHAALLTGLGRTALASDLLNDAERLFLEARWWADEGEIRDALQAVKDRRRAVIDRKDAEVSGAYQRFLDSAAYAQGRAALWRKEEALTAAGLAGFLALARDFRQGGDSAAEAGAVDLAFRLEAKDKALAAFAGPARLRQLGEARRRRLGLERLELGAIVAGAPVTTASLKGKVVLWRSFSL